MCVLHMYVRLFTLQPQQRHDKKSLYVHIIYKATIDLVVQIMCFFGGVAGIINLSFFVSLNC